MVKRGYYRSSGRSGRHRPRTPSVPVPSGTELGPGELCSAGLLAFGASFVFGRLVATVVWGGSTPTLLLGLAIGLTFAAAGTTVLCVVGESRSRHAGRVPVEGVFTILSVVVFVGSVLGALF